MRVLHPAALRAHRRAVGLSRDQAAVAIGRTVSALIKYETRRITPTAYALARLADAYGCDIDDFFTAEEIGGAA